MKYCIVGAGGTGGSIAAYLERAKKDVTLIARGQHLVNLKQQLFFKKDTTVEVFDSIKAASFQEYAAKGIKPDVIFLCTKSYSLGEVAPFIKAISGANTVVIPVLNGISTGEKIKEIIPEIKAADGCMYIVAEKTAPGKIFMRGDLLRVVFGSEDPEVFTLLEKVADDLKNTDIDVVLSSNIMRDTLRKFSLVSAMAACGLYYDIPMGPAQQEGEEREFFKALCGEVVELAEKLGATYDFDLIEKNLNVMDHTSPLSTTSLQRDVEKGGANEAMELIGDPIRLGAKYDLEMPAYRKVAEKIGLNIE